MKKTIEVLMCNFCKRTAYQVRQLITADESNECCICEACVFRCVGIMCHEGDEQTPATQEGKP